MKATVIKKITDWCNENDIKQDNFRSGLDYLGYVLHNNYKIGIKFKDNGQRYNIFINNNYEDKREQNCGIYVYTLEKENEHYIIDLENSLLFDNNDVTKEGLTDLAKWFKETTQLTDFPTFEDSEF